MDRDDLLNIAYNHQNTYIRLADQKASILLSGQIAFVALILNLVLEIRDELAFSTNIFLALTIFMAILSIASSILTIIPREESTGSSGFVYWEEIRQYKDVDEFTKATSDLDSESSLEEISKDVFNLSKVAQDKYKYLRMSIVFSSLFIMFGVLSLTCFVL